MNTHDGYQPLYLLLLPSTQMIDNNNGAFHVIYWGDIWRSTGNDGTVQSRKPFREFEKVTELGCSVSLW